MRHPGMRSTSSSQAERIIVAFCENPNTNALAVILPYENMLKKQYSYLFSVSREATLKTKHFLILQS
jgi:hypothetical protein